MANTYQLARFAALPCGNGQLQQVNVQHTHIVCVMYRWFTGLLKLNLFCTLIIVYICFVTNVVYKTTYK